MTMIEGGVWLVAIAGAQISNNFKPRKSLPSQVMREYVSLANAKERILLIKNKP